MTRDSVSVVPFEGVGGKGRKAGSEASPFGQGVPVLGVDAGVCETISHCGLRPWTLEIQVEILTKRPKLLRHPQALRNLNLSRNFAIWKARPPEQGRGFSSERGMQPEPADLLRLVGKPWKSG